MAESSNIDMPQSKQGLLNIRANTILFFNLLVWFVNLYMVLFSDIAVGNILHLR